MPCILDSRRGCYGCRAAIMNQTTPPINVTLADTAESNRLVPCSPYYTGPSGPVSPVPWCYRPCAPGVPECWCRPGAEEPLPPPRPGEGCFAPAYGFFYQTGSFTLSAAGCLPLNGTGAAIRNVEQTGGVITLAESGVYDVSYTLTLPASATATGSVSLLRGGSAVPGTTVVFAKTATGAPVQLSNRSIITAAAGTTLCIGSSAALALTAAEDETLATLVIRRIG